MQRTTNKQQASTQESGVTGINLVSLTRKLQWWMNLFKTELFEDQPIPQLELTLEKARITTLGQYKPGQQAQGIRDQINLNQLYLERPLWDILSTLLHEMTHCWEFHCCQNPGDYWYHSKAFREMLGSFGILCDANGRHLGLEMCGTFIRCLKQHGITLNGIPGPAKGGKNGIIPLEPIKKVRGNSKLKKWTCGCVNIRVAVSRFKARCLKCGNKFKQAVESTT